MQPRSLWILVLLFFLTALALPPAGIAQASVAYQLEPQATVKTGSTARLNVRSGPGTQYPVVAKARNGEIYPVLARDASGIWVRLARPKDRAPLGWANTRYLTLSVPLSQIPVAAATPPAAPLAGPQPPAAPAAAPASTPFPVGAPGLAGKIAVPVFDPARQTYDVWLVNADGTELRRVVPQASQPALSPDGRTLAYRHWRTDDRGIVVQPLDAGAPLRVTSFLEDGLPSWSPDGKRIVFSSFRESDRRPRIYYLWADAMQDWVITRGVESVYGEDPSWLADGRILYRETRPAKGLTVMNFDGGNPDLVVPYPEARGLAATPDGRTIAFMLPGEGGWDIYRANVDGTDMRPVVATDAKEGLPAWSPDGSALAFVSDRGGSWGLWVVDAAGGNPRLVAKLPGSIDGRVEFEPDYLNRGWLEEQISWSY